MQNKILGLIGIVIVAVIAYFGIRNANRLSPVHQVSDIASTTATSTSPVVVQTTEAESIKKTSWAVFERYLGFLKTHDIAGMRSVSYQNSDTCDDPTKTKDCFSLMDNAYNAIKIFSEADFHHVDYDQKQTVLATDFWTNQDGNTRSFLREIIYFYRDSSAGPKIIAYTVPFEMTYVTLDPRKPMATSTADTRLTDRVKDNDHDYLPDEVETCSYQNAPKDCVKTDPNKRDTLGDGWWDGVRILLKPTKTI